MIITQQTKGTRRWLCATTATNCKGAMKTEDHQFHTHVTEHNDNCTQRLNAMNNSKQKLIERMKQAVEMGVAPREAYEEAILSCCASVFWGYQEVSQQLYATRRKQGILK